MENLPAKTRYDWTKIQYWARWAATGENGKVWGFAYRPILHEHSIDGHGHIWKHTPNTPNGNFSYDTGKPCKDYADSLEARPI
jgi:hypothetical protein